MGGSEVQETPSHTQNIKRVTIRRARNVGIDVLRIFSIAAVVLGHSFESGLPSGEYLEIWRMPLFFFLTGYFWTMGRPFSLELSSRWKSLGVPYLAWGVLISIWVIVLAFKADGDRDNLLSVLANGWYGGSDQNPPWWAFWFISVLFFTSLLRRFLERFPIRLAWSVSILGLLLALLPDSLIGRTPLGMGLALPCLFFLLCGEAFRHHLVPRITKHRALIGFGLFGIGIVAVALGLERPNVKFAGFGDFLITPLVGCMMAAGLVLIFRTVVNRFVHRSGRAVSAIVKTGTVVVLLHGWLLGLMPSPDALVGAVMGDILQCLMVLGISWSVGIIINATLLAPLLSGVPFRRAQQHRSP